MSTAFRLTAEANWERERQLDRDRHREPRRFGEAFVRSRMPKCPVCNARRMLADERASGMCEPCHVEQFGRLIGEE